LEVGLEHHPEINLKSVSKMRMIGIGLLGFLLAGFALLLSTMDVLEKGKRYAREVITGPQLVFETLQAPDPSHENTTSILHTKSTHPVLLSGLPAYQSVAFDMPVDARPTSGYLQVDATFQVLEGVEGVLRISIDNARRGEMLLRPGEVGRSLQIQLSPKDFARSTLVVSFSLQGRGPHLQCSTDEGFEAIVEIEPTSAIFLTLDRPLLSVRDRVNASGAVVRIAWPHWLKSEAQMRRLILASQLHQNSIETLMVGAPSEQTLNSGEIRDFLRLARAREATVTTPSWPRALDRDGVNAGLRKFHRQTVWRTRFDLGTGRDARFAEALDLRLQVGKQIGNHGWMLRVALNNRLLFQTELDARNSLFQRVIALPVAYQSASNTLEVTLTSTNSPEQQCDEGPELIAEMMPQTRLTAGATYFSDAAVEMRTHLSRLSAIYMGSLSEIKPADAQVVTGLLAELLPQTSILKPNMSRAEIIVLTPGGQTDFIPNRDDIWLIFRDTLNGELVFKKATNDSLLLLSDPAILVALEGLDMPEVAS
jgi:hypothetical protein